MTRSTRRTVSLKQAPYVFLAAIALVFGATGIYSAFPPLQARPSLFAWSVLALFTASVGLLFRWFDRKQSRGTLREVSDFCQYVIPEVLPWRSIAIWCVLAAAVVSLSAFLGVWSFGRSVAAVAGGVTTLSAAVAVAGGVMAIVALHALVTRYAFSRALQTDVEAKIIQSWFLNTDAYYRSRMEQMLAESSLDVDVRRQRLGEFFREADFFRAATEALSSLPPGDRLFAVCSTRAWDSQIHRQYFRANVKAVERGARVQRILVTLSPEAKGEITLQLQGGVDLRVARTRDLAEVGISFVDYPHLEIDVIGREKIFMWNAGRAGYGVSFESRVLVQLLMKSFEHLWGEAKPLHDDGSIPIVTNDSP